MRSVVVHRMKEGYKGWKALKSAQQLRIGYNAKKCLHEGVVMPAALYEAATWGKRSAKIRRVNVLNMKYLRSTVLVT